MREQKCCTGECNQGRDCPLRRTKAQPGTAENKMALIVTENNMTQNKDLTSAAVRGEAVAGHEAHFARLTLIRASGDEELIEAVKMGKVSIHAALLKAIGAAPVAGSSTDWRIYHSALGKCADMLDNMADNDALIDVPIYLGEKLAALASVSARAADAPSEPSDAKTYEQGRIDGERLGRAVIDIHNSQMAENCHYRERVFNEIIALDVAEGLSRFARIKSRAADALDSQPTDQSSGVGG